MSHPIIWLHDEALRVSHPVFSVAPKQAKAIYIWDDAYLRQSGYSLKRLVFVYETLCALPIEIIQGDTLTILLQLKASAIYIPNSQNPFFQSVIRELSKLTVQIVQDETFVIIPNDPDLRRFFHYWKKAEKTAFMVNGDIHA